MCSKGVCMRSERENKGMYVWEVQKRCVGVCELLHQ